MDAKEIGHRIALLFNPMPDMSGNNINRLHGEQRRRVERLAAEISAANIGDWLTERMEQADKDADAHPEGSGNRSFYRGQAVAYENAFSALKRAAKS